MPAKRRPRPIIVLTRRYGGEVNATTSRLQAYVAAIRRDGAEAIVVTRFPLVHPGRTAPPRYRRRSYMRETIDGVTVLRLRIPGERIVERLLDRAARLSARLRGRREASLLGMELVDLLYGVLALPVIAALRPRALVIEQGPAWLGLPLWSLARAGVPLVLHVGDVKSLALTRGRYGTATPGQIDLNRRLEDRLYGAADAIVTVTEALRDHIAARLGPRAAALHLVPNGAELEVVGRRQPGDRERYKRRLGLEGRFVVLYAGTFGAAHDLLTLLETARRLRDVADIAFVLIGEGAVELQLVQTARAWDLGNVTLLPGVPLSELATFLGAADVGISTEIAGLRDTVRSKIYLYMAACLPVVATDDGGEVRRLMARAGAGYLTPPGDAAAIAERLRELKGQPRAAAAFAESGRHFVERHHARSELARRFAGIVLACTPIPDDRCASSDGPPSTRAA